MLRDLSQHLLALGRRLRVVVFAQEPEAPGAGFEIHAVDERREGRELVIEEDVVEDGPLDADLRALAANLAHLGDDLLTLEQRTSSAYILDDEYRPGLAWSRWVLRHSNLTRIAARRRAHYQQWASAIAHLPYCHSLFPLLANDIVPYVFPLWISHPQPHFYILKHLGVPVGRWDDMAISSCRTAASYRLQLLHLPCHQELSARQMTWMTAAVRRAMLDFSPDRK